MKRSTMTMMTAAMLMNLFILTACAEKDHTGMAKMAETPMKTEMKDEAKMMGGKMAEPMEEDVNKKMDTMKDGMDSAEKDEMKKME